MNVLTDMGSSKTFWLGAILNALTYQQTGAIDPQLMQLWLIVFGGKEGLKYLGNGLKAKNGG